jgi:4'-phosphopantetheinyl transferase
MATPVSNRSLTWDALLTAAHAWQFCPDELRAPAMRDRWLSRLSADESERYEQFRTEKLREGYLAARVLCRATLSRYTGVDPSQWRFGEGLYGKPTLVEPVNFKSLRFNLAHTDDLVICIVTRAGEVGVDVEETSRTVDVSAMTRHFFSRRQQARLASLPSRERAARFFEQWVLKEAYVKATGKGLAYAPERLTIEQGDSGEPVAIGRCQFSVYRPSSNHVAAAAVLRGRCAAPVSIHWRVWTLSARPFGAIGEAPRGARPTSSTRQS